MSTLRGRVKWFDNSKGWGFIERSGERDIFVHHSSIEGDGYKTFAGGQEVQFEILEGPKGPQAQSVSKLG